MRLFSRFQKLSLPAVALLALSVAPARANIILSLTSVSPPAGPYTWTYGATLVDGFAVNPPPAPCPTGFICDGLITIYDFAGFTGATTEPAGWTFLGAFLTGVTPVNVVPSDDPFLVNLSWGYTGLVPIAASGSNVALGSFTADSIYNTPVLGEYATRNNASPGIRAANLNSVMVPSVPEPASLVLFGSGLLALATMAARRRRR